MSQDAERFANLGEGRAFWFFDTLDVALATEKETGGSVYFSESLMPPGSWPPLHVHPEQEEGFYILEGAITLYIGRDVTELKAGQFALAPRAIPHTFLPTETTRLLGFVTGEFGAFVREVSAPATEFRLPTPEEEIQPDFAELERLSGHYGATVLGPPGMLPTELPEYRGAAE